MPFPNSFEALTNAGYVYSGSAYCRKCKAPIRWYTTPVHRKPIPIDADGRQSHWGSCPFAASFKTKGVPQ